MVYMHYRMIFLKQLDQMGGNYGTRSNIGCSFLKHFQNVAKLAITYLNYVQENRRICFPSYDIVKIRVIYITFVFSDWQVMIPCTNHFKFEIK